MSDQPNKKSRELLLSIFRPHPLGFRSNFKEVSKILVRRHQLFLKFCTVGGTSFFFNTAILWVLTELVSIFYLISSFFSIEFAVLYNFFLNEWWTWRGYGPTGSRPFAARVAKYHIISVGGIAINLVFLWGLTSLGLYYLISNWIGVLVATGWNYVANARWTWGPGA